MNYYNEFDPNAAAWLRELIAKGIIPYGHVDTRSIHDVHPGDLDGYTQCHFFAGIGGWPEALRLAGWPEDRPVWTGSCPCQPFSGAGKQLGTKDPRHLWPQFRRLIRKCRPATVFGEQVASSLGRQWLDGVFADLEALDYANCGADLCAAGVRSPHIRQRLWWAGRNRRVANANCGKRYGITDGERREPYGAPSRWLKSNNESQRNCEAGGMEHSASDGREQRGAESGRGSVVRGCGVGGMVHAIEPGLEGQRGYGDDRGEPGRFDSESNRSIAAAGSTGFWDAYELIPCLDGKARRIEPGTFPLATGVQVRMGLLRGYGNAIVPQVAAEFVKAYIEVTGGRLG